MVRLKYIVIALVVVSVGLVATLFLFQSEEKKLKKQVRLLSEYVSKDSDESTIAMARKMQKLGTLFDASCELKIPVASLTGAYTREEISSYAARGRARFSKVSLTFFDLDVTFSEGGAAKVNLTARLEGRTNFGEVTRETRELLCLLRKIDGQWLFNSMEAIEVLRK